jgi:hypothetical protein
MNTEAKIFNSMLAGPTLKHIKRIIYHNQWDLSQGAMDASVPQNQSMDAPS